MTSVTHSAYMQALASVNAIGQQHGASPRTVSEIGNGTSPRSAEPSHHVSPGHHQQHYYASSNGAQRQPNHESGPAVSPDGRLGSPRHQLHSHAVHKPSPLAHVSPANGLKTVIQTSPVRKGNSTQRVSLDAQPNKRNSPAGGDMSMKSHMHAKLGPHFVHRAQSAHQLGTLHGNAGGPRQAIPAETASPQGASPPKRRVPAFLGRRAGLQGLQQTNGRASVELASKVTPNEASRGVPKVPSPFDMPQPGTVQPQMTATSTAIPGVNALGRRYSNGAGSPGDARQSGYYEDFNRRSSAVREHGPHRVHRSQSAITARERDHSSSRAGGRREHRASSRSRGYDDDSSSSADHSPRRRRRHRSEKESRRKSGGNGDHRRSHRTRSPSPKLEVVRRPRASRYYADSALPKYDTHHRDDYETRKHKYDTSAGGPSGKSASQAWAYGSSTNDYDSYHRGTSHGNTYHGRSGDAYHTTGSAHRNVGYDVTGIHQTAASATATAMRTHTADQSRRVSGDNRSLHDQHDHRGQYAYPVAAKENHDSHRASSHVNRYASSMYSSHNQTDTGSHPPPSSSYRSPRRQAGKKPDSSYLSRYDTGYTERRGGAKSHSSRDYSASPLRDRANHEDRGRHHSRSGKDSPRKKKKASGRHGRGYTGIRPGEYRV